MNSPLRFAGVLTILAAKCLFAGQIYGSLSQNGHPMAGARLTVVCGNARIDGTTAADGSFRMTMQQQGRCNLAVTSAPGAPSIVVFSYPNPVQYDLILVQVKGGYQVQRR